VKISDYLYRVLVHTDPAERAIVWLTPALVEQWGVTVAEAEAAAAENLAELLRRTGVETRDAHGHTLGMLPTNSGFKAALIFSPNLRQVVEPLLGWPIFATIPNRQFAYLIPEKEQDFIPHLGGVIVEEYLKSGYPISPEVFHISDQGIKAIGAFKTPDQVSDDEEHAPDGMKVIRYRGGVVRFFLPEHWEEEYVEEGGGTFYDEDGCGELRLNVLSLASEKPIQQGLAASMLGQLAGRFGNAPVHDLPGDNAILVHDEADEEGQEGGTWSRFWLLANPIPPQNARIAIFSFTCPVEEKEDPEVDETVAMLEHELRRCRFSKEVGE
jgi:hypothetical protein